MTGRAWTVVVLLLVGVLGGGAVFLRCEGTPPELIFEPSGEIFVGASGIDVSVTGTDEASGIRDISLSIRHANGETVLASADPPGDPVMGGALKGEASVLSARIEPEALGLAEGSAILVAEARDWSWADWFGGNATTAELPVTIDLSAPRVSVRSGLTYVQRAGAGLVRYQIGEDASEHGVRVGDATFRGYPVPGGAAQDRIALFAIPRDMDADATIRVHASDAAGNRREVSWPVRLLEREFDSIPIRLGTNFMEGKVPSLAGELGIEGDDAVKVFQTINQDERARNEDTIRKIVSRSGDERHFDGAFLQMTNSAVTSKFAEHRTYYVDGETVSQAIHYGYDLASLAGAPIEAANAGVVLHAAPLGIYGNCVLVDHGLGLTSLYGHLREMEVKEGDRVERGQTLGRSGSTGLAGGDHLHFAIMVGATYVDPKEWWDAKWVREHVDPAFE